MRAYDHILFDLDGTLTDPGQGIMNAIAYALDKAGEQALDRSVMRKFIGPPLSASFQRYCGFSEARAGEAVRYYREYYAQRGLFENVVYPDIPETLERLREAGFRLSVATGKPEEFSLRILERFGLAPVFTVIAGASMDNSRIHKDQVIRYCLTLLGNPAPERVLMVGDREHDVLGAAKCGIRCMGVLYGYGAREELLSAGAAALAETPGDVARLLLS